MNKWPSFKDYFFITHRYSVLVKNIFYIQTVALSEGSLILNMYRAFRPLMPFLLIFPKEIS